nr:deoxygenase [Leptospira ilyithenensis]
MNSSYLTSLKYCKDRDERIRFFRWISQKKLFSIAKKLIPTGPYFLNTQIFYNPKDNFKKPYWHRDVQYLGVSEEEQKKIIGKASVLHFRIPFLDDPGLDFIPGSHSRWDTEEERIVRLELDGHGNGEEIYGSKKVPHTKRDLLVFSAHLLHRGDYSKERFSLDILYTGFKENSETVKSFQHFPEPDIIDCLENQDLFATKETSDTI